MKQLTRIFIVFCSLTLLITGIKTVKAQQVLSTAGNHLGNGAVQLSWTVGEPVISTVSSDDNILTQGMHQSRLTITAIEEIEIQDFEISAFPNPATEFINLRINNLLAGESNARWGDFSFRLYDINGKLMMHKQIESTETIIPMNSYPPSTYFLKLTENNREVKTFKITKQ